MSAKGSSNLNRFKKDSQGLIAFATLIEQADQIHREMILTEARNDDPRFLAAAMKKVVFFDEIIYLDDGIIAELVAKISPKVLAFALHQMPEEFRTAVIKQMGPRELRQLKDEELNISNVPTNFVHGARRQVLKTARQLEKQNKFVFELTTCPRFDALKKKA